MVFPILREYPHRNLILNSLPLSMTDKPEVLAGAGIHRRHFLFTTESPEAVDTVIRCERRGLPLNAPGGVKRIQEAGAIIYGDPRSRAERGSCILR